MELHCHGDDFHYAEAFSTLEEGNNATEAVPQPAKLSALESKVFSLARKITEFKYCNPVLSFKSYMLFS